MQQQNGAVHEMEVGGRYTALEDVAEDESNRTPPVTTAVTWMIAVGHR